MTHRAASGKRTHMTHHAARGLNVIFTTFEYIRITLVRIYGISTGILWNLKSVVSSWYGLTCSVFVDLNGAIGEGMGRKTPKHQGSGCFGVASASG